MFRTLIKDLKEKIGEQVIVKGFIQAIRDQGGIKFIIVRDVTGIIQAVILKNNPDVFNMIKDLTLESVIELKATVKQEKQAPGGFELEAHEIKLLSHAAPELPIPVVVEKGGEEPDATLRFDWRWLDLRREEKRMIFEVWTSLEKGLRRYFTENGFIQVYSPSFMSAPSESGADVFEVNYFDRRAYLAQSPQFYKQMAMAAGFEKVFMTGPVFRAEPSFTTRHMTEFTGWDMEMSYINSHYDVMAEEEKILTAAFVTLKEELGDKLDVEVEVPYAPFPKLTMAEAKEKLKEKGVPSEKILDLSPEEEREICDIMKKETGHDFLWITDYHKDVRPFYHMRREDDPDYTKSFDLMYRGVEVTTGAQREHRYDVLVKQAKEKGMDVEFLQGYLNFFKYGCPPHGGIGIGPGRIIMKLLDLQSVKEATFLPRDVKRVTP